MKSLDDKHLEQLKKLLVETHDLVEDTVHVQFDAEGRMHVTARKNGLVRPLTIEGEIIYE